MQWESRVNMSFRQTLSLTTSSVLLLTILTGCIAVPDPDFIPGSIDPTFDPGTGPDGAITSAAVQSDGRIFIGGEFTHYNGTAIPRIARLMKDGSLDPSFDPGVGPDNSYGGILTIALQPDGKLLISGGFTSYDGTSVHRIARIESDGTLDATFDPGTGPGDYFVSAIALQPDGRLVVGGSFRSYDGVSRNRIARLNVDGSLDVTFDPGSGANDEVHTVSLDAVGRVLIGGVFTHFDGVPRRGIARLNTDGTLDESFNPNAIDGIVRNVVLRRNGRILISGGFSIIDGPAGEQIACLTPDGTVDPTFAFVLTGGDYIAALFLQRDNKIVVGGLFFSRPDVGGIARINPDGTFDHDFLGSTEGSGPQVHGIAGQTDGKIIVIGWFTGYGGSPRRYLARAWCD
jgi:uncharacterized delta-60 repeat protein